jgi:hypothetical protein
MSLKHSLAQLDQAGLRVVEIGPARNGSANRRRRCNSSRPAHPQCAKNHLRTTYAKPRIRLNVERRRHNDAAARAKLGQADAAVRKCSCATVSAMVCKARRGSEDTLDQDRGLGGHAYRKQRCERRMTEAQEPRRPAAELAGRAGGPRAGLKRAHGRGESCGRSI